jgi:thymidylate kinase
MQHEEGARVTPRLIVLEGPDGVGKTRHVRALTMALIRAGINTEWSHHQPPGCTDADPWTAALHFAAERDRLRRRVLRGATADVIVCDRWWLSTQVLGLVLDSDALGSLAEAERRQLGHPDLTVVLTAPDAVLDERLARRGTPTTDQDRALRRAYESHAWGSGLPVVDTSGSPTAVTARLVELVREATAPITDADRDEFAAWVHAMIADHMPNNPAPPLGPYRTPTLPAPRSPKPRPAPADPNIPPKEVCR